MALSKKDIFSFDDIKYKKIKVWAWGGNEIILRSVTAEEKVKWSEKVSSKNPDQLDYMIDLIIICAVDDDHKQLFEDSDKPALKNKNMVAIQQIFEACVDVATLGEKSVEKAAKN